MAASAIAPKQRHITNAMTHFLCNKKHAPLKHLYPASHAGHIDIISQGNENYLPDGRKTYSTDFLSFSRVLVMSLDT